jgi:hypothetical protein
MRKACEKKILPKEIWQRLDDSLLIILTVPNGWTLAEQDLLQNACCECIKDGDTHDDLYFVTEGEASAHWALAYSRSSACLLKGITFAIVDAGKSTVDSTVYEVIDTEPRIMLHEACASECVQMCLGKLCQYFLICIFGSLDVSLFFVDRAARTLFETKLGSLKFAKKGTFDDMELNSKIN